MKKKKDKLLMAIGFILIFVWFADFFYDAVLKNNYSWLLWYSSAGLLMTGISLVFQKIKLIYSLFCALFVAETLWIIDSIYILISHQSLIGIASYMLSPTFHMKDLFFTLYHILIPISLITAVLRIKKIYKYGWIGASIYALTIGFLTFLMASQTQVNCLNSLNKCKTVFSFMYGIENPFRIFIAVFGLTFFIFIPTNYILIWIKERSLMPEVKSIH